jgi:hypothetical protein
MYKFVLISIIVCLCEMSTGEASVQLSENKFNALENALAVIAFIVRYLFIISDLPTRIRRSQWCSTVGETGCQIQLLLVFGFTGENQK